MPSAFVASSRSRRSFGSRALSRLLVVGAIGLGALGVWPGEHAASAEAKEPHGKFEAGCRLQPPQAFLERRTFVKRRIVNGTLHVKALKYLVKHYGNAGDPTTTTFNAYAAAKQKKNVRFFGLPLEVHAKVAPALACVEKRIQRACTGSSSYTPRAVGGFRTANTFRGTEVSNHLLGIAIDIDPEKNPCCGCVDPWPTSPRCKTPGQSVFEKTAMPKCWIRAFEAFGFDWLGHDELEDTMHFEFLGEPDRIKK